MSLSSGKHLIFRAMGHEENDTFWNVPKHWQKPFLPHSSRADEWVNNVIMEVPLTPHKVVT